MKDIYINKLEESKLKFADFILCSFNENKHIFSFSLIFRTKHIVLKGSEKDINRYLDVASIKIKNDNNITEYSQYAKNENIKNTFISSINNLLPETSQDYSFYDFFSSKIKQQPLYKYEKELSNIYNEKDTIWNFNRNTIIDDINNFLGIELIIKKNVLFLDGMLKNNNLTIEERTKI